MNRLWSIGDTPGRSGRRDLPGHANRGARVVVSGNQPVTIDQVKQKLEAEVGSNIQITPKGRIIRAVVTRDGKEQTIDVEASIERLRIPDDDEEVTDENY